MSDTLQFKVRLTDSDIERIVSANRKAVAQAIEAYDTEQKKRLKYFTSRETAEQLGCSIITLARWRENGYIQGLKIGGKWLYTDTEINKAKDIGLKYRR